MDVDVEDEPHIRKRFDSEGIHTATSEAQQNVEAHAESIFKSYLNLSGLDIERGFPLLRREEHKKYLFGILYHLPDGFSKLDASHPWLTYWIVHSLALLDVRLDDRTRSDVFDLLQRCYDVEGGGFGGGQYQYGHLATTYAATNTLVVMGSELMWSKVDRKTLKNFLYRMRVGDGSFFVHEGGESDIRAVYCAIVVAKILNIQAPDLFEGTVSWILQCQSYEGGFGGSPGGEAHGGYSFCAVAALYLLNALNLCDLKALLRWTVNRQMTYEGGFQGRTNKLVDSCYSFWQGATVILAQTALLGSKAPEVEKQDWLFDKQLLQEYVLLCCQDVHGGLKDKPEVNIDPYHTCYALSGMSISQSSTEHVVGDLHKNRLRQVHPAYNLPVDELSMAMKYFYGTRSSSEGPSSST